MNPYNYVGADPMRSIDPWGLLLKGDTCPSGTKDSWGVCGNDSDEDKNARPGGNESSRSFAENPASSLTSDSCGPPDILGKLWALPNTAIGLVAGSGEYAAGLIEGTDPSLSFANNAIQVLNTPIGGGAVTLGNVEIFTTTTTPTTVGEGRYLPYLTVNTAKHEETHTYQSQALGPFFLPIWAILGGASPNNPLETSADLYGAVDNGSSPGYFGGFSGGCSR